MRISIKMPAVFPFHRDRYVLEYEMRYQYQTIMIGLPMKLTLLMERDEVADRKQQRLMESNFGGNIFGEPS